MNLETMTNKLEEIFIKAIGMAKEANNPELCSEHLFKAFLDDED